VIGSAAAIDAAALDLGLDLHGVSPGDEFAFVDSRPREADLARLRRELAAAVEAAALDLGLDLHGVSPVRRVGGNGDATSAPSRIRARVELAAAGGDTTALDLGLDLHGALLSNVKGSVSRSRMTACG
jgi:hypothetical protein